MSLLHLSYGACWKKSHDLLSSALIASIVCSICGALHEYSWYGVATLSNGCRCVLFFWSMEKFRLNAGLIWFNNSIKEWHKWLGVAGFGLKSSSEDLERIICTLSLLMLLNITWQYYVYFSSSLCNTLNCPLASSFLGPENILLQPLILNIHNSCSSLKVKDYASHKYKINDKKILRI